jgi:RNA polymerase sigma-70 factor (ECF subfamily)
MEDQLLPHLFRTEYHKIVTVLSAHFGFAHSSLGEDIASDTFLTAAETWGQKGLPANPVAWLYHVAKNKARDHLRHARVTQKAAATLKQPEEIFPDIDLSEQNIRDSQLRMMFAICQPVISPAAQTGLALRILCGFGIDEIADAFLSNKETINKRLFRAKETLRKRQVEIAVPSESQIGERLPAVLATLYLLFNEGYYSSHKDLTVRKDLCLEAMRLVYLLVQNELTNLPEANALLALMCYHASRFDARVDEQGEMIRYDDQDRRLWNDELIARGHHFLHAASNGDKLTKYHLEATMAYWHTQKADAPDKWENILQLYNRLLQLEYSPVAALNRTYALAKARGKEAAIAEAVKLPLTTNHLYHVLMGYLYRETQPDKAQCHLEKALQLARTTSERNRIRKDLAENSSR